MALDMGIKVRVKGVEEVYRKLKDFPLEDSKKILERAMRRETKMWAARASALAPMGSEPHWVGLKSRGVRVQPGNLKASIYTRKIRQQKYARETDASFGVNVRSKFAFYWQFIEFGTSKMSARPFLRPAFDQMSPESLRNVANDMQRFIANYMRKRGLGKYEAVELGETEQ